MSTSTFQFDETAFIGDDHPIPLVFYDKDSVGNLTAEDISDRKWYYTAKRSDTDTDDAALIKLDDITVDADPDASRNPGAVLNRLNFVLPKADTINASAINYIQDLQSVVIVGGLVFTRGYGTLTMKRHITIRTA